jgi:hypothetical protein
MLESEQTKSTIPRVSATACSSTCKFHCSFCQTEFQTFSQQDLSTELKLWQLLNSRCGWDQGTIINHHHAGGHGCHSSPQSTGFSPTPRWKRSQELSRCDSYLRSSSQALERGLRQVSCAFRHASESCSPVVYQKTEIQSWKLKDHWITDVSLSSETVNMGKLWKRNKYKTCRLLWMVGVRPCVYKCNFNRSFHYIPTENMQMAWASPLTWNSLTWTC